MSVAAVDIANLCCLYKHRNNKFINKTELETLFKDNMRLELDASFEEVISNAVELNLLAYDQNHEVYVINDVGILIGRKQIDVANEIHIDASKVLIKKVYFNLDLDLEIILKLVKRFNTDPIYKTFLYERPVNESYLDNQLLLRMTELKFFEHREGKILVNKIYITIVSAYFKGRTGLPYRDKNLESESKKEIGDLTESLAFDYEKRRMIDIGQTYLSDLVIRYGGLDDTRGYDIESFEVIETGEVEKVYIEVKGTMYPYYRFIWSENERYVAEKIGQYYWLYCYKNVDLDKKIAEGPYITENAYETVEEDDKYEIKKLKIQVKINL